MKRITCRGLLFALIFVLGSFVSGSVISGSFLPCPRATAQNSQNSPAPAQNAAPAQEQPLGDVARKIAHKDTDATKAKPKVFDNDNLPTSDKISVVGQASDAGSTKTDTKDASKPGDDEQAKKQTEWNSWHDKVTAQKDQVDLATRELDVLQREYQLRAAEMYGDAGNRLRNSGQWDKQDADYKQKIADKQKDADEAKQKLEDIQEQGRKAGVPSSMLE